MPKQWFVNLYFATEFHVTSYYLAGTPTPSLFPCRNFPNPLLCFSSLNQTVQRTYTRAFLTACCGWIKDNLQLGDGCLEKNCIWEQISHGFCYWDNATLTQKVFPFCRITSLHFHKFYMPFYLPKVVFLLANYRVICYLYQVAKWMCEYYSDLVV